MAGAEAIPITSKAKQLELVAKSLTELQRTYLLLAFEMDQERETANMGQSLLRHHRYGRIFRNRPPLSLYSYR
jgi:phospholipid N-methyltransferase